MPGAVSTRLLPAPMLADLLSRYLKYCKGKEIESSERHSAEDWYKGVNMPEQAIQRLEAGRTERAPDSGSLLRRWPQKGGENNGTSQGSE